jgi:hypothetical protein
MMVEPGPWRILTTTQIVTRITRVNNNMMRNLNLENTDFLLYSSSVQRDRVVATTHKYYVHPHDAEPMPHTSYSPPHNLMKSLEHQTTHKYYVHLPAELMQINMTSQVHMVTQPGAKPDRESIGVLCRREWGHQGY